MSSTSVRLRVRRSTSVTMRTSNSPESNALSILAQFVFAPRVVLPLTSLSGYGSPATSQPRRLTSSSQSAICCAMPWSSSTL